MGQRSQLFHPPLSSRFVRTGRLAARYRLGGDRHSQWDCLSGDEMSESVALGPQPDCIIGLDSSTPRARAFWRQPCLSSRSTALAEGHAQAKPAASCAFRSCSPLAWARGRVHARWRVGEPELPLDCGGFSGVIPELVSKCRRGGALGRVVGISRGAARMPGGRPT